LEEYSFQLNPNLLYLGTDNGAYISLNKGQNWERIEKNLPAVAVHDLVVQPEANHLVLGTHGRSLYVIDVSLLQDIEELNKTYVSAIKPIGYSSERCFIE